MCLKISTIWRKRKEYTIFANACTHLSGSLQLIIVIFKTIVIKCIENIAFDFKYWLLMWVVKNVLLDWISKKNNSHSVKNSLCKNVILHISKTTFLLVFEQQKKEYLFFLLLQIFEFVTVKISDKFHSNWGTNFHCSQLSFRTAHGLVLLKCV